MYFEWEMLKSVKKLYTVYDLAAFCYDYLLRTVGNQTQFLGKYIMYNENADVSNPNLEQLEKFSGKIESYLRKREDEGLAFSNCMELITCDIKENILLEYGDPILNDAAIPFYILLAIDRYVQEKHGRCSDSAPLNKEYCGLSYIYLNVGESIISEAAYENNFSDVILESTIRNQLLHLVILEKTDLPKQIVPPKVVRLWIGESDVKRKKVLGNKKVNIAVIPFSRANMLEFPIDNGALFHVEYNEYHLKSGIVWALRLLELAIDCGANIITFPEYICSLSVQDAIQERLRYIYQTTPERLSSLLLIVAGSGWTEDNNNVAKIFSYSGEVIGKQYKISEYSDLKNKRKQMLENLNNPGKETTIVEVEGLGKVLVGICRDISARSYTKELARVFSPQLLLVPAWSRSVNIGFKEQFREIASENHRTCSILCNCCEAMESKSRFKKQIGLVTVPYKKETTVVGKTEMICRDQVQCAERCAKGGCIYLINIDFSPNAIQNGRNINWEQHFEKISSCIL